MAQRIPHSLRRAMAPYFETKRVSEVTIELWRAFLAAGGRGTDDVAIAQARHDEALARFNTARVELAAAVQELEAARKAASVVQVRQERVPALVREARRQVGLARDRARKFDVEAWLRARDVPDDDVARVLEELRRKP